MSRTLSIAGILFGQLMTVAACGDLPADADRSIKQQALLSANLANQGSFEAVGAAGPLTTWSTTGSNAAAADGWSMVSSFGPAVLSTEQDSFVAPNGGSKSLHVRTDRASSGIVQVMSPLGSGPTNTVSTVQVYVTRGQVGFGVGDGGNTGLGTVSTTTGRWETLVVPNHSTPSNEIIVYATSAGGADFYIDNLGVYAMPNLANQGSFEAVGAAGSLTTWSATGGNAAAADGWSMASPFGPATLSTQQDNYRAPNGGSKTLHVRTDRASSGIVQVMSPLGSGPTSTVSTVQVYVARGQVGFGVGDGGNTRIGTVSTTTGRWETLVVPNHSTPSNEIIVYATSAGGADFYIDNLGVYAMSNLANQGSFEAVGAAGPLTTWSATGSNAAAADGWSMASPFGSAMLSTRHDSYVAPNGGSKSLYVSTDRASSGIVQVMSPLGSGPTSTVSTVQVYVTRGQVGFGVGDGGNTGIGAVSTTTGRWETLVVPNHSTSSNEIIVYATSMGGADFYVDNLGL
jgi:type IV pilus biogenesis protein CpaD/CtpE